MRHYLEDRIIFNFIIQSTYPSLQPTFLPFVVSSYQNYALLTLIISMRTLWLIAISTTLLLAILIPTSPGGFLHLSRTPHALSDNDIIQTVFEGLYAENKLQGPYMIKYCFDAETSHNIVVFMGQVLEKAARGSVSDLLQVIQLIKGFANTIPEATIDCLGRNEEINTLGFKYNIDGSTDFDALELHVAEYVALHYLEVHRWAGDLNDKWKGGKYYDMGFAAGGYGHKLFPSQ